MRPEPAAYTPDLPDAHDAVIDVRSPSEFSEDHIPGAINLPVLDDAERARVGTVYKQLSPFEARRMGAALVARNIARAIEGPLSAKPPGFSAVVYCWRGGMRSNAFAHVAAQIGWRMYVMEGGWKAYRAHVRAALYEKPLAHRLVLLDGDTGSAKTAILREARAQGAQTLDLEALANHRGSALGHFEASPQPGQKRFESALFDALRRFDPAVPVLVEAESNKLGKRVIPASVWAAMQAAPRLAIEAPVEERARHAVASYRDIADDPEALAARLAPLIPMNGRETVERWMALARAGDLEALAGALIEEHYDPAYARARTRSEFRPALNIRAASLAPKSLPALAARIVSAALSLDASRAAE